MRQEISILHISHREMHASSQLGKRLQDTRRLWLLTAAACSTDQQPNAQVNRARAAGAPRPVPFPHDPKRGSKENTCTSYEVSGITGLADSDHRTCCTGLADSDHRTCCTGLADSDHRTCCTGLADSDHRTCPTEAPGRLNSRPARC